MQRNEQNALADCVALCVKGCEMREFLNRVFLTKDRRRQ
jgi:hypothetical protein